ncbi:hypothetical protein D3C75_690700 [compost metagenome]
MLQKLQAIINSEFPVIAEEILSITYERQTVAAGDEIITSFAYFTVNMLNGEYLEIHENQMSFNLLSELFTGQLVEFHTRDSCSVELYSQPNLG